MEILVPSLLRIKPKAMDKLGRYLKDEEFRSVALFWAEGMKELFGERITVSFASSDVGVLQEGTVIESCIEDAFAVGTSLPAQIDAIVAIGGGKTVDFCKYIAFMNHLPVVVVPTSISNDGFCSPGCSLLVRGKRKSIRAQIPYGVIVDTEVVQKAPRSLLYSGIGDLFCKLTAIQDWKLAFKAGKEEFNDFAATVCLSAVDAFTYYPNKSAEDMDFLGTLARSLLMCGISMEIAQSSRPASGAEHLISHAYDQLADTPSFHGIQVGVASYVVSYAQGRTFEVVRNVLQQSGFADYVSAHARLKKDTLIQAVRLAPSLRKDRYTVLDENGQIEKMVSFIENDPFMNQMLA